MLTIYHKRRKLSFEEMTVEELRDCIECLHDYHLYKVAEEHWPGLLRGHLANDDEQGVELNQIAINGYWIDCPLDFIDHKINKIIPNCDYARKLDMIFLHSSILQYYTKEGKLVASKNYSDLKIICDDMFCNCGEHRGYEKLKQASIYLETLELYIKIKQVLLPDLIKYCILLYCDWLGDKLPRNIKINDLL